MSKEFVNSLKEYAQEANKDCPHITDEGVRMERAYLIDRDPWQIIVFVLIDPIIPWTLHRMFNEE